MLLVVAGADPGQADPLPSWLHVSGRLYGLAIVDTGGGPRQRPEAIGTLSLDATPTRALHGLLELRGRAGGPFEGGSGAALYNFDQTFQNYSPALEVRQAFVEWRGRQAEVRAGIQTFAWGKLDGVPPTDVVDPRDWHDPLVVDEFFEEQKIGIPALLGTYFLPDVARLDLGGLRLSAAWIPFGAPPRLPLLLERWFPQSVEVPTTVCPTPMLKRVFPCPGRSANAIPVNFGTANAGPFHAIDTGGVAAHIGGTWHGADFDLYHYTGAETGPNVSLRAVVRNLAPGTLDFDNLRVRARLTQEHDTMHMTGGDVAFPIGPFTVRTEAAWFVNHAYLRPAGDLLSAINVAPLLTHVMNNAQTRVPLGDLFPRLDTVEWGIGADTLWRGFQPLLQLNQIVVLGSAPRLLISDPETRLLGLISRRFADDRLEAEVRTLWEIEKGGLYVFPRVSYQLRESLWLRAGYLVLVGPRNSVLGQFRANDEVVFQARMTF